MDFVAFLHERLGQVDRYLFTCHNPKKRLYALGRLLEIEQLAFTLRNADCLTLGGLDEFDESCERVRRRHRLHADYRDFAGDRPYNGRFLPLEPSPPEYGQ